MADEIVSEILMKTTIFQPTTNVFGTSALLRVVGLTLGVEGEDVVMSYSLTGSSADLNIRPLLSCIGDIDIMFRTNRDIVIPESCDIPEVKSINSLGESVALFRMQPALAYPGYMNLLEVGSLEWDETSNRYVFSPQNKGLLSNEIYNFLEEPANGVYVKGPAMRIDSAPNKGKEVYHNISYDIVRSIPCPYWPSQATAFITRHRSYNWPTKAILDGMVNKGCDIVHISHALRRNVSDRTQWRLSFSRAETILMHTWTNSQKIIFHMLRYFYRKQLSQVSVLASFHLKTLMLWSSEQHPPDFWKSSSLVHITSKLLTRLVHAVKDRRLENYFISDCNLFISEYDDPQDSKEELYDELIMMLMPFTRTETLTQWFLTNYIATAASQYSNTQLNQLVDKVISSTQSKETWDSKQHQAFVQKFLAEYKNVKSIKIFMEFDRCMKQIFVMHSYYKRSLGLCELTLNKLPESDRKLLDFYAALIYIEAAYQMDETKSLPGRETINLVAEVLIHFTKDRGRPRWRDRCHKESAESYLNQALVLVHLSAGIAEGYRTILIELAKACLIKSLECTNGSSLHCVIRAYLAALFHETKDYQMAKDCIEQVVTKKDHSACYKCTMQPKLLPLIDRLCNCYGVTSKRAKHDTTKIIPSNANTETSPRDVTPEIFAFLYLSFIEDKRLPSWNQYAELINEIQVRLRASYGTLPEDGAERNERSSEKNDILSGRNSKRLLHGYTVDSLSSSTHINKQESKVAACTHEDASGNSRVCNVSGNSSGYNQIKLAVQSEQTETEVSENIRPTRKLKIYSRSQLSSEEKKIENMYQRATKLEADAYNRFTSSIARKTAMKTSSVGSMQRCVTKTSSEGSMKRCVVNSRLATSAGATDQESSSATNHSCKPTSMIRSKNACYLRDEHGDASVQLGSIKHLKNTNIETDVNLLKPQMIQAFGASDQQQLLSNISGRIRQSLVDSLTELSVYHLTTLNYAIKNDPDISVGGIYPDNYMALYLFKCGRFQLALDICNRIKERTHLLVMRAVVTDLICSPPFCLLLPDDLRAIAEECSIKGEILFLNVLVMASYIQTQCFARLNRPALEVAVLLLHVLCCAAGHTGNSGEFHSKIFTQSRKDILKRYRGRIREGKNDSLVVSENGVTKVVRLKNNMMTTSLLDRHLDLPQVIAGYSIECQERKGYDPYSY